MKSIPKTGTVGEATFVVSEQHLIDFVNDGMPQILCTPWLIWFLEHAARNAMVAGARRKYGRCHCQVEHTAATPIGNEVTCRARVIHADGPLISLQLEAHDQHEQIARGTHKLRVIEAARLARRVEKKTQ